MATGASAAGTGGDGPRDRPPGQDLAPDVMPAGSAASAKEAVARPAALVAAGTLLSRIAGVARESIFAAVIGAGAHASAFTIAFRIPNLLRDLFAEGALSSAFVPTYSAVRKEQGDEAALRLARTVLGTLLAVTTLAALVGVVLAGPIVDGIAARAEPSAREEIVRLTRIMFPFLPTIAAAAVLMGVLNSHRRIFVPAFAPTTFNLVAIAGGAAMWIAGWGAESAVVGWSVLVLVGGLVQALVQVPALRGVGWRGAPRVDLRFRDPALRTVVRRMGPIALALSGTQVMIVFTTSIASGDERWPAALNYAFRLIHLPIGLIGVALGTVALAAASRLAAERRHAELDDVVRRGLRLNLYFALPSAAGLAALATPLVQLVYERGEFRPADTLLVAEAVRWYAIGVAFYAGVKVATAPFHARGDTKAPMVCSLLGIAATLVVAFVGTATVGFVALPLSTAAGTAVNFGALRVLARRRHGAGSSPGMGFGLRVLAATAVTGGAAFALSRFVLERGPVADHGFVTAAAGLCVVSVACLVLYVGVTRALRIDEASGIVRALTRRRAGSAS